MKVSAIIPGAGRGERFGKPVNKVLWVVAGKPVLAHTLSVFEKCRAVSEVVLVVGEQEIETADEIVRRFGFTKVSAIVPGGKCRQDSVANGLKRVTGEIVVIHDAARPLVTCEIIERSIEEAARTGACIAAVPVIDTIKCVEDGVVGETLDRCNLYAVQTPQTFRTDLIVSAHDRARADGVYATDDAALVERLGIKVTIVPGSYDNIKMTTPEDLDLVAVKLGVCSEKLALFRTGLGYDVHRLVEGRRLFLGGVEIQFDKGLAGHSDADVVLHAIADACLGAAALGDIGRHFPDTDPQYKDVSSLKLLECVGKMLVAEGWRVINVDAVVVCERPKIAPYVPLMIERIAGALCTDPACISVKGTTTEGLGFTGRGEGIGCYAIAALANRND
jgi:2-C-methyl-D-erythritol 4-phosphate cytidylyltransferase/2-C-methyl-D-erythritol 2,4-cyclodiphosphate synthase